MTVPGSWLFPPVALTSFFPTTSVPHPNAFAADSLIIYPTENRKKEIGVRKVNGATTFELVTLLLKDFSVLVLIAFAISVPVAYFFGNLWLDNFAYKTNIGVFIFILSGIISLLLAVLTVSYHTIKAARANPVKALRYE